MKVILLLIYVVGAIVMLACLAVLTSRILPKGSIAPLGRRRAVGGRRGTRPDVRVETMLETFMRMFRDDPAPAPTATAPAARPQPVRSDPAMPGIPEDSRGRIGAINELLAKIETRIQGDPMGIPLVIEMENLRDRHLPKLLTSYVAIDPAHRRKIFEESGKSASVHLAQSLDAMAKRLQEIDRDLSAEDINAFTDNARFISRTYGQGSDPLL